MTYKSVALIALLLPFSGYAITKEERKQEILNEISSIDSEMNYIHEIIKHNFWVTYFHGQQMYDRTTRTLEKLSNLQKELDLIEQELKREETCIK